MCLRQAGIVALNWAAGPTELLGAVWTPKSTAHQLSSVALNRPASHLNPPLCRIALQLFASGLFQAGYRDRAAAIYSTLLLQDADRVHQAELLRRCLR